MMRVGVVCSTLVDYGMVGPTKRSVERHRRPIVILTRHPLAVVSVRSVRV
jgi:hypothetical protein